MKGLRLGLNGYTSWFTLGDVPGSTFFRTAGNVFPATVSMGNNVHCMMLNLGLSSTKVTDIVYHVNKLKIGGKTYTKVKDKNTNSESEVFFDLLLNVKTSYDDMRINNVTYAMLSPVRGVGFRTVYNMRWYNNGSGGIGIGVLPGLKTDQLFDNIFFTLFFGWDITKIKD